MFARVSVGLTAVLAVVVWALAAPGGNDVDYVKQVAGPEDTEMAAAKTLTGAELEDALTAGKRVPADRIAGASWDRVCLSRGMQQAPEGLASCWPSETDRNLGGSFINVTGPNAACTQLRTTRRVIDRRFEDSFCVARAEVPGLVLRARGKILDIE